MPTVENGFLRTATAIDFEQLVDAEGRIRLLPAAEVAAIRAKGLAFVELGTINLSDTESPEWITCGEAARLHLNDCDGLELEAARRRIDRAIAAGKIRARGEGLKKRIDPVTLNAWRLEQRERELARDERDPEVIR